MKTKNSIWLIPLIVMGLVLILSSCKKKEEETSTKITDKDGNVYTSVTIGTQVWMVENLKTTKYNDGTSIPNVTDDTAWGSLYTDAYCWYNNDITNKTPYGALYNWYAVYTGKLCPTGWHVPTDTEWYQLLLFIDPNASLSATVESQIAAIKLKEVGNTHWESSGQSTPATNETGFTALPAGVRWSYGCVYIGQSAYYWPSTSVGTVRIMWNYGDNVMRGSIGEYSGASVRCMKD
jgi:uncharacterized protein (TIGR02145 family)